VGLPRRRRPNRRGPTFVGTWIGYLASSDYLSVAFLAIAAGALLYC